MESINQSNYLGKEKLSKLLARFAIPCILSLIISCLYNIVDQIFIGNMIGTAGNAATGIIFPITVIGCGASLFSVTVRQHISAWHLVKARAREFTLLSEIQY